MVVFHVYFLLLIIFYLFKSHVLVYQFTLSWTKNNTPGRCQMTSDDFRMRTKRKQKWWTNLRCGRIWGVGTWRILFNLRMESQMPQMDCLKFVHDYCIMTALTFIKRSSNKTINCVLQYWIVLSRLIGNNVNKNCTPPPFFSFFPRLSLD